MSSSVPANYENYEDKSDGTVDVRTAMPPVTRDAGHYGDILELAKVEIDPQEEKKLLRALDANIAPIVMIL